MTTSRQDDALKRVLDMTSRIDERLKTVVERQNEIQVQIDKILERQQLLMQRITALEAVDFDAIQKMDRRLYVVESAGVTKLAEKIQTLEIKVEKNDMLVNKNDATWKSVIEFAARMLFMFFGGYVLWKLGWQQPPTP